MINPAKTKEYYLALQKEKEKEIEKHQKDARSLGSKISSMQFKLSSMEIDERTLGSRISSAQGKISSKLSQAASKKREADALARSNNPKEREKASKILAEARALENEANREKASISSDQSRLSNIKFEITMYRKDISFEEKQRADSEFKAKKALKEMEELKIAVAKANE